VTLAMDKDGRPDKESVLTVVRATSHLATRIEFLRGALDRRRGARQQEGSEAAAGDDGCLTRRSTLDKLVELDNEDENDRPKPVPNPKEKNDEHSEAPAV
jgi:hypothetical protein